MSRAATRQAQYQRRKVRLGLDAIAAAEADTWKPACMTADELASWHAKNLSVSTGHLRASRPCVDCTLGYAIEQRAQGTCNGEPGGVEQDEGPEDERFLAKEVGPDQRALQLLADAVLVPPVLPLRYRERRHGPIELVVGPPPQPGDQTPVDAVALLAHIRGVGAAASTPDRKPEEAPVIEAPATSEKLTTAVCAVCATTFAYRRRGSPQLTCSRTCKAVRDAAAKAGIPASEVVLPLPRDTPRPCLECGTEFWPRANGRVQLVCSEPCRTARDMRFEKDRKKARRAAAKAALDAPSVDPQSDHIVSPETFAEWAANRLDEVQPTVELSSFEPAFEPAGAFAIGWRLGYQRALFDAISADILVQPRRVAELGQYPPKAERPE